MLRYILKRIALLIVSLFIIMTLLFVLIRMLPNSVQAVQGGYSKALEDMREAWGYNKPIIVQYSIFLKNIMHGDWGFCTTMGTFLQPVSFHFSTIICICILASIFYRLQTQLMSANIQRRHRLFFMANASQCNNASPCTFIRTNCRQHAFNTCRTYRTAYK